MPMSRRLLDRLRKLEAALPPHRSKKDEVISFFRWLSLLAIAYYLGDSQPDEPIIHAYKRALGIEDYSLTPFDTIKQHHGLAFDRLLAKFGVSRSDDWEMLIDAFTGMADDFSGRYKEVFAEHERQYRMARGIECVP
jgi:hypothetical protein